MSDDAAAIRKLAREYKMPLYGEWHILRELRGLWWRDKGGPNGLIDLPRSDITDYQELFKRYERNRSEFFLPHGVPWHEEEKVYGNRDVVLPPSQYDKSLVNDGLAFTNDDESDYLMFVAPRKTGKSFLGAFKIVRFACKCEPTWHTFKNNGVKFREYQGPRIVVIGSFSWTNVKELWEVYREVLPRYELGPYAPEWGKFQGEGGRPKNLAFGDGKPKSLDLVESKSRFIFLCYTQQQHVWENFKAGALHADEQIPWDLLTAWEDGTRTMGDYTPAIFTLSGFTLPERPDTGMAGPIYYNLWEGNNTRGKTIGRYNNDIPSTPDAIVSKKKKKQGFDQYVNPKLERSEDDAKRGMACFYPGWQPGAGLVLENFDSSTHIIPTYDRSHPLCRDTTKYRGTDHGLSRPCATVWAEVFPWGDIVIYREYYKKGGTIPMHAVNIVAASGNTRIEAGIYQDSEIIDARKTYEEVFTNERYMSSVLDGRSFASPAQEIMGTMGQVYNQYGLWCTAAKCSKSAKGEMFNQQVENTKTYLRREPERPHIMWQFHKRKVITEEQYQTWLDARNGEWKFGSTVYFVDSLDFTFREFRQWAMKNDRPEDANNHIAGGAFQYLLAEMPRFFGKMWDDKDVDWDKTQETGEFKYVRY